MALMRCASARFAHAKYVPMVLVTDTNKDATPNKILLIFSCPSKREVDEADKNPVTDEITITGKSIKVRL